MIASASCSARIGKLLTLSLLATVSLLHAADAESTFILPGKHFALCSSTFELPLVKKPGAKTAKPGHFNHIFANITQDFPKNTGGQMQVWTMPLDTYTNKFLSNETRDAAIMDSYKEGSCPHLVSNCVVNTTVDASTNDTCVVIYSNLVVDPLSISYFMKFSIDEEETEVRKFLGHVSDVEIVLITTAASIGLLLLTVVPFAIYEKLRFRSEESKMKLKDRLSKAAAAAAAKTTGSSGVGGMAGDRIPLVGPARGYRPIGNEYSAAMELEERINREV